MGPASSAARPSHLRLACRRMRWVIEGDPRVCALHNEPHHQRMFFPPLLALHLALLREYNFPRPAVSPNQGSNFGANCRCSSSRSPTNFMASRAGFSPQGGGPERLGRSKPLSAETGMCLLLALPVPALTLKSPTAKSQTYSDFQEAAAPATAAATVTPYTET